MQWSNKNVAYWIMVYLQKNTYSTHASNLGLRISPNRPSGKLMDPVAKAETPGLPNLSAQLCGMTYLVMFKSFIVFSEYWNH